MPVVLLYSHLCSYRCKENWEGLQREGASHGLGGE